LHRICTTEILEKLVYREYTLSRSGHAARVQVFFAPNLGLNLVADQVYKGESTVLESHNGVRAGAEVAVGLQFLLVESSCGQVTPRIPQQAGVNAMSSAISQGFSGADLLQLILYVVLSCDFHHIDGDLLLVFLGAIGSTWGILLHGVPFSSEHYISFDVDLWLGESHFSLVGRRCDVWIFLVRFSLHGCISLMELWG
jgi:hypothetical protein